MNVGEEVRYNLSRQRLDDGSEILTYVAKYMTARLVIRRDVFQINETFTYRMKGGTTTPVSIALNQITLSFSALRKHLKTCETAAEFFDVDGECNDIDTVPEGTVIRSATFEGDEWAVTLQTPVPFVVMVETCWRALNDQNALHN